MSRQRLVGFALAVATVVIVLVNQRDLGIARDETVYVQNGAHYADWWIGLVTFDHGVSTDGITKTFGGPGVNDNNREHPPLMKTLFGLSERLLHKTIPVFDELTAFRFPSAVMAGVLVLLVYFMVLALWGFAEAILAALLVLLMPRALFHAGLACFDAPMTTLWFATVYAYWRALDGRKWPWQVGVTFGLALATKHNAVLLPFAFLVHYAYVAWNAGRWHGLVFHRPRVLISLAVLGPLTLVALWPWLWFSTYAHVHDWLAFHMTHVHYNFEYLGQNWNAPRFPWHVALVTTLFTVPVATLVSAVIGCGVWLVRRGTIDRARAPALLLVLSAGASMGPFFLGSTPIFGAEKHWAPAIPTICIAAAVGAVWAARAVYAYAAALRPVKAWLEHAAIAVVGGAIVLAAAVETVTAQPYALTWYNALAGGAPGGADLGMNRQFWGVAARGVLPFLDAQAPPLGKPPAPVYAHDDSPAWGMYQRLGLVSSQLPSVRDLEQPGIDQSRFAIVIHERHFNRHDYMIWKTYGTTRPIFVLRADGVPIVSVYKRP